MFISRLDVAKQSKYHYRSSLVLVPIFWFQGPATLYMKFMQQGVTTTLKLAIMIFFLKSVGKWILMELKPLQMRIQSPLSSLTLAIHAEMSSVTNICRKYTYSTWFFNNIILRNIYLSLEYELVLLILINRLRWQLEILGLLWLLMKFTITLHLGAHLMCQWEFSGQLCLLSLLGLYQRDGLFLAGASDGLWQVTPLASFKTQDLLILLRAVSMQPLIL